MEERPTRRQPFSIWLVMASVLLAAMAGGIAGGVAGRITTGSDDDNPASRQEAFNEEAAIIAAFQKAAPSVVAVFAEGPSSQGENAQRLSLGSGVIIDERGYILTNEHVVRDARTLRVRLTNGEERRARLVGHDAPFTDLAVIAIPQGGLQAIRIAGVPGLVPGQKVIAIGNSIHDLSNSVTLGVISGLGRRWYKDDYGIFLEDLIQTDAAVNPGNSGGALTNRQGELIGVPTMVVRSDNGSEVEGISLAISSETAAMVAGELIERGFVDRPALGILHQDLWPELSRQLGLTATNGALITKVIESSPAAAAGLVERDVIISIDGVELTEEQPLLNVLQTMKPGQQVRIVIERTGQRRNANATLAHLSSR